jgi:hypothetical protein
MTSQVPVAMEGKTKFIELGTKFDCNNVRVEGGGLALSLVLETSRVARMVPVKDTNGVETEEPVIAQRTLELSVKLPLDTPKVIFDSNVAVPGHPLKPIQALKPVQNDSKVVPPQEVMTPEPAMQIEMTASELK